MTECGEPKLCTSTEENQSSCHHHHHLRLTRRGQKRRWTSRWVNDATKQTHTDPPPLSAAAIRARQQKQQNNNGVHHPLTTTRQHSHDIIVMDTTSVMESNDNHNHNNRGRHRYSTLQRTIVTMAVFGLCFASIWTSTRSDVVDPRLLQVEFTANLPDMQQLLLSNNVAVRPKALSSRARLGVVRMPTTKLHNPQSSDVSFDPSTLELPLVSYLISTVDSKINTTHANGTKVNSPPSHVAHARVVFLGASAATSWKQQRLQQQQQQQHETTPYPVEVRTVTHDEEDVTRIYGLPTTSTEASSSDLPMERRQWPVHEIPQHEATCRPMHAWQSASFPVCNSVHELDWTGRLMDNSLDLLTSRGFWRHVWKHESLDDDASGGNPTTNATVTKVVWKTFKLKHGMEEAFFENSRVDALAMERLTASPHVIDIYGFCAMTVLQQFAGKELSNVATKRMPSKDRLDLAVQVAQGVADMHGIDSEGHIDPVRARPSLAHNDMNLANLVFTMDNRPVWNDFNIAILLMQDNETNETCPYYSRFPNPQWRAPEEQILPDEKKEREDEHSFPVVTENTDLYALGNVLYRLAVTASPWKKPGAARLTPEEKLAIARAKKIHGILPPMPVDVKNSTDPYIHAIVRAMRECYQRNPADRPSALKVVRMLQNAAAAIVEKVALVQDNSTNTTLL